MKVVEGFFKLLVRLYPQDFRERFGEAMRLDMEDSWRQQRSTLQRAFFLCRTGVEALTSAFGERRSGPRKPAPVLAPGSSKWGLARHDLRHALYRLVRQPAVTAIAITTLALGLGVAAAVYTLVDGVLLSPLPYPEPERLVRVWSSQMSGERASLDATWREVERFRELKIFAAVAAFSVAPRDLSDNVGRPSGVELARISEGLIEVIGVTPSLGRGFTETEYREGAPVVLLADGFWRSRYGGDPSILGQLISIQGVDHQVVGVVPPNFDIPHGVALWRPFNREENLDDDRELVVIARLATATNSDAANVVLETALLGLDSEEEMRAWVQPFHAMLVRDVRGPLIVLLAAVIAVLLLACANVAHLQLARVTARSREIAVRSALGASDLQVKRLLLLENLVQAVPAGVLGLGIGQGLLHLLLRLAPSDLPRLSEVSVNGRVVLVMATISCLAGLLAGWLPARSTVRSDLTRDLRGERDLGGSRRAQRALVTTEVALATVLAVAAGLLYSSAEKRLNVDHGLEIEGVMELSVSPPARADNSAQRQLFYGELAEAIASVPGVEAAGVGNHGALDPGGFPMPFELPGQVAGQLEPGADMGRRAVLRTVDSGWMRAARLRLLAGRLFDPALERAGGQGTAIVDETFARVEMGLENPAEAVGRRIRHPAFLGESFPTEHQIVGVVATVRADGSVPLTSRLYLPYEQFPWARMKLLVRISGDPSSMIGRIRDRIWAIDPTIPLDEVQTLRAVADSRLAHQRFQLRLMGAFSQLALLLAATGLYAVLCAMVAGRTRELGLRRALGASPLNVTRQIFSEGLSLVVPGLVLGLIGAVFLGRSLAHHLHGVEGLDPGLSTAVAGILLAVTAVATLGPLRRALRVDPMTVLREG